MGSSGRRIQCLLTSVAALVLAASPARAQPDPSDPFERMNRRFFNIQEALDRRLFGPIASHFGKAPSPVRAGLRNFSLNLAEPVVFANDMLQGRVGPAARTLGRFAINSTFGLLGFVDIAKNSRLPHHANSFGTTLARWGAAPGPYLFLPFFGPSTLRDTFGDGVDIALNPLTYANYEHKAAIGATKVVVDGLGERVDADQQLNTIRQTSTDPYATLRSFYLQNRQSEITGKPLGIETLPEFDAPTTAPDGAAPPGETAPSAPPPAAPSPSEAVPDNPAAAPPTPPAASPSTAPAGPGPPASDQPAPSTPPASP